MDSGRLPDDRSFTYSVLIRTLVRPFDALPALLGWQALAGIITALIVWHVMVSRLGVPRPLASIGVCLLAIEPAQLYYERMVLAETFGLLAFVIFLAAAAAYVANARAAWLPIVALTGLLAASLRLNYLPVVLVVSVVVPLLRMLAVPRPSPRVLAGHTAIAVLAVVVTHGGYQQWVALIFNSPPGYIARAGFMQLGLVLPLVKPEHLARVGLPRDFGEQLQFPLSDPDARMPHMWAAGGFIRALRERNIPIEPVARPLARMALADDPVGLVRLGMHTLGNYFRAETIGHALDNDLGRRVIPNEILWTLREIWHYDADGLWMKTTPVSWYFEHATWGLVACLMVLLPLTLLNLAVQWNTPFRAQTVLVVLVSIGLVLAQVLLVPVALYRYLHPLPLFVLINAGSLVAQMRRQA